MDRRQQTRTALPAPATYFPIRNGRYDVSPALSRLGTDFGNGAGVEANLFSFDSRFEEFRVGKLACRRERFGKYVCTDDFSPETAEAVLRLCIARLTTEHPTLFTAEGTALRCHLTGETLHFDAGMRLNFVDAAGPVSPPYADAFDALCCQFPEDIAIVRRSPERGDWIAALHLCAPSAWAAEEKIGQTWDVTHAPVPGMEKIRTASRGLVAAMIEREPTVRFTWSIQFTDRLNDHPEPPPGIAAADWRRREPDPDSAEAFYLRVERQVIWGLPEADAALFAIRIYHTPLSVLAAVPAQRDALRSALLSMSPESRRYKSIDRAFDRIIDCLR